MDAVAPERVRAGSVAWQIVDLGAEAWEVVIRDARKGAADTPLRPAEPAARPGAPDVVLGRMDRFDERLAALEGRFGAVEGSEERVGELERAHGRTHERIGELERGQAEMERGIAARDAALREEIAEIYRDAARAVVERYPGTERKPRWLQRRHELKLARLERDRKIREAERRLTERTEESLARIDRRALIAEDGVRETGTAAELELQAAAGDVSERLRRRMLELLDDEHRLTALMGRIEASEERLRSAERRAEAARANDANRP